MAKTVTLSGTLTVVESAVTLVTKTISQILADLTEAMHLTRFRVADAATETVPLPATTGRFLALFLTGGPITAIVGSVSEIIAQNGILIQQTPFTALSLYNASGANVDVEVIIAGDDSA